MILSKEKSYKIIFKEWFYILKKQQIENQNTLESERLEGYTLPCYRAVCGSFRPLSAS